MDFRPATGEFYLLTHDASDAGRLYTVNTSTAAATFIATLAADPADSSAPYTSLSGANFGVDFNPVADRLRVVSGSGQNLRINVTNGSGHDRWGPQRSVGWRVNAAYLNNFAGATATTLFDIDASTDRLYTQNPPNSGTLVNVGPLGVNATAIGGFDIRANGEAYAALTVEGVNGLYSIDLTTGAATLVGSLDGRFQPGFAIAPNGTLQFSAGNLSVTETSGTAELTVNRVGGTDGTVSVLVNTVAGTATAGSDFVPVSKVLTFGPGVTTRTISIPVNDANTIEDSETFTVELSSPYGGAVLNASDVATVTIVDTNGTSVFTTNGTVLNLINAAVPDASVKVPRSQDCKPVRPCSASIFVPPPANSSASAAPAAFTPSIRSPPRPRKSELAHLPCLLDGNSFGFDFNPTVDRIRVVSNAGQNLRLNPDTGQIVDSDPNTPGVQSDSDLAYATGDSNQGQSPNVVGSAYTNNVAGATTTTLYGIDSALDILVTQNPPNNGTLNTVGALGVNATGVVGFDVRPGRHHCTRHPGRGRNAWPLRNQSQHGCSDFPRCVRGQSDRPRHYS
jgi:hypothetical protein